MSNRLSGPILKSMSQSIKISTTYFFNDVTTVTDPRDICSTVVGKY